MYLQTAMGQCAEIQATRNFNKKEEIVPWIGVKSTYKFSSLLKGHIKKRKTETIFYIINVFLYPGSLESFQFTRFEGRNVGMGGAFFVPPSPLLTA